MQLKGMLLYKGWINPPWEFVADNGDNINIWPIVEEFFNSLNCKRAEHKRTIDSYTLFADKSSKMEFTYIPGEYVLLESIDDIGMFNVNAYLGEILVRLSGRKVDIEIENGERIKITPDKSEKVHGVYRVDGSNTCNVSDDDARKICKIGQFDCCVFLTMGAEGFYCEKFSGMFARELLDRLAKHDIRATRIGSCELRIRGKE